jgi:ParB-like nuclease domain
MSSIQSEPVNASPARPWPADRSERWPIGRLIPYANHARLHSEADLDKIAAAIRKWGWTLPPLVDETGVLIVVHARVGAAAELGLAEVPVMIARGWTEDEKRAYRVADNQLAARASWDFNRLNDELCELDFKGFDLGLIGFEPDQLRDILAGSGADRLRDPDSSPEVLDQPVSGPGHVWVFGDPRVGCGNSTTVVDVAAVLAGSEPHLMVTDPPYGVGYDPSWRARRVLNTGKHAEAGRAHAPADRQQQPALARAPP